VNENIEDCMIIHDYISPAREILANHDREYRRTELMRLLGNSKRILRKIIVKKVSIEEVVEYMLTPDAVRRIRQFDLKHWIKSGHVVAKRLNKLLDMVPEPTIVLYPSMRRVNGKIIHIDGKPAIALSPDFGFFGGDNLSVVLAHEYTHYLRACHAGVKFEKMPMYKRLFEEGLAVYITTRVLPDISMSALFMSNLHRVIGLNDPSGGYIRWCRRNLAYLASEALDVLGSKSPEDLIRFFDCGRFDGDDTPVRTGYYLGYIMVRNASTRMNLKDMITMKLTSGQVRNWLKDLAP
jgi:hypothetical protein